MPNTPNPLLLLALGTQVVVRRLQAVEPRGQRWVFEQPSGHSNSRHAADGASHHSHLMRTPLA